MTQEKWKIAVDLAREGQETTFNFLVNEMYETRYYQAIQKITKDASVTREVYTHAITKFWERFILKGDPLPSDNINGYVYNMSRNAFIDIKRQKKRQKECEFCSKQALNLALDYSDMIKNPYGYNGSVHKEEQDDYELKMNLLTQSISQLEATCQEIIRRNVYEGELLKDLKSELGFTGTYQSIVEKKKRCMRRLSKLMFSALESPKTKSNIKIH